MKSFSVQKKIRQNILLAVVLFLVALSFRLWDLNATGGTWDEIVYFRAGKHYVWHLLHLNFDHQIWAENAEVPPMAKYIYGATNLLFVKGQDDYTASRVLSAIMAALTCIIVYLVGKEFFEKRVGILAALILAFLPPFVAHGKIAGIESPLALFFSLTVYLFLRGIKTGNQLRYLLSGIVCGVSLATKFTALLLFILIFLIFLLAKKGELLKKREITMPLMVIFFPLIALLTLVALWPWLWRSPFWQLMNSAATYQNYGEWIREYFLGKMVRLPVYYYLVYFSATTPTLILILLVAFVHKTIKNRTFYLFALALWLLVPFLWSFAGLRADGIRYIYPIYPPLSLISAIGFFHITDALPLGRYKRATGGFISTIVVGYLVITCLIIHPYYLDYYNEIVGGPKNVYRHRWFEIGWWGEGIKEAVEYVNKNASPGSYVYLKVKPSHEIPPLNSSLKDYRSYADNFSIRWEGKLKAPFEDNYTFYTISDDGVRLWIDEKLIINNWTPHAATENRGNIHLVAGDHKIKLEFYEGLGEATIKFLWSSGHLSKSIIPSDYLFYEADGSRRPGLRGRYYNELDFKGLKITRVDSSIDFDWKEQSPFVQGTDYVITNTFLEWYRTGFSNPHPDEFKEVYVVKAAGAPLARVYQRIKVSPQTGSSD
jgi:4-amino-4-deoxy-L-arabinose transferase-like glycosyltransferase